jgi:hypothetical protein
MCDLLRDHPAHLSCDLGATWPQRATAMFADMASPLAFPAYQVRSGSFMVPRMTGRGITQAA